ncbi:MAG TPA: KR domain-containing protein [Anaerolinea thermolimosa]|uniref:KR domain-containing protein n=1 Tax=Anaerolinea thermolimosa TaxID=229919 RepID=A0A3D1JE16_9CHLR|nr:SDR family NAD(P)-dependent oxidoreductase [Anaerolinea thermolimosa]GAP08220.1 short-chain dehydrogenase of various substrate specificities [Anaerolinea thermolimosa]HCE16497.1 KR domain-containing protein [Anaerolinea thermolimosa]
MHPYFKEYKWSNVFTMIHNLKLDPKICTDDFPHRLVVITGATAGIGRATARKYASHGADLVLINRNPEKSEEICEELRREFHVNCTSFIADFSRLSDIHRTARYLSTLEREIDVLIHNAGIYLTRKTFTQDGIEAVFQINYLSTFILNDYLLEKFKAQSQGRILFVNSEAYRFAVWGLDFNDLFWNKRRYSGLQSYGAAKLAQLLSMIILNEYFQGTGITVNAMHPGNVKTNSGQNNGWLYKKFKSLVIDRFARPVEDAAEALYYLGVSPEVENVSGKFFNLTTVEEPAPPALDRNAALKLWEISMNLRGLYEKG